MSIPRHTLDRSCRHWQQRTDYAFATVCLLLSLSSCAEPITGERLPNRPPETTLWVDTIATPQPSRAHLFWRGDDPDGFVIGFLLSTDGRRWFFTHRTDTVLPLSVGARDTSYVFAVAAVDNSTQRLPTPGSRIEFADLDGNGVYTDGEPFRGLEGAHDPTPARLLYPVRNSPPRLFWGSDTTEAAARAVWLPETTFTVATFRFTADDPDGAGTIAYFEWALNDTTTWKRLNAGTEFFTIRESDGLLPNAENRLFLRAVDIGGLSSPVLQYPPPGRRWYVRKPRGPILVLHDYAIADGADTFYTAVLERIAGGRFRSRFDWLDIRTGRTAQTPGRNVPPFLSPMFVETLLLFDAVLWYADQQFSFDVAQAVLPEYLRRGGKLLLVTTLPAIVPLPSFYADITPVDSLSPQELFSSPAALPNGSALLPDSSLPEGPYPVLRKVRGVAVGIHELFPNATAAVLYRLPPSRFYSGTPAVAVRSGDRRTVFLHFPLHLFSDGAEQLLERVLLEEFQVQ